MSKFIVIKKTFAAVSAAVLAAAAVVGSAIVAGVKAGASAGGSLLTVVIDAGHGGIDNGVSGVRTGTPESELNLLVARLLKENFEAAGFNAVMTRTDSRGLYAAADGSFKKTDMKNRKKVMDEAAPDLVVSIHMNKYPLSSRRGAQVFYRKDDQNSQNLARSVQAALNAMPEAVRECSPLAGDYYILNNAPAPAVLVECGFLSSPEDEALLLTDGYRRALAYAVFKGMISYLASTPAYAEICKPAR